MLDIKLIIFDLDGTLIDAYTAINNSFNFVMRRLDLKSKSPSVIRRAVGWGDANLLKPFVENRDLEKALDLYRLHHKMSLLKYSRLYPQVRALLKGLKKQGYKLAVASNRPQKFSLILLRHLGIKGLFDYILCADKLRYGKPNPLILNSILKKFKLKKSQALYVGDMSIDALAARRAGIRSVIVTGGSSSIAEIKKEKPFRIIPKIAGLQKVLFLDSPSNR